MGTIFTHGILWAMSFRDWISCNSPVDFPMGFSEQFSSHVGKKPCCQVVCDVENLPSEVLSYFRRLPYRPQLSAVRQDGGQSALACRSECVVHAWSHIQTYMYIALRVYNYIHIYIWLYRQINISHWVNILYMLYCLFGRTQLLGNCPIKSCPYDFSVNFERKPRFE